MSPLQRVIGERRSIRRFSERPVLEATVWDLLDVARTAPSPHNSQPWRFTILRDTARCELALAMGERLRRELEAEGMPADQSERQVSRSIARISAAPCAVLCSIVHAGLKLVGLAERDRLEVQMAVQSVGCALQTLFLAATERGLGCCWMAAPMYCQDVVVDVLALPADYVPQALVLMGYPSAPPRPRSRLPLSQVVHVR